HQALHSFPTRRSSDLCGGFGNCRVDHGAAYFRKAGILVGRAWACHPLLQYLMRYLVTARVKAGKEKELLRAIENQSLGRGSVARSEEHTSELQSLAYL